MKNLMMKFGLLLIVMILSIYIVEKKEQDRIQNSVNEFLWKLENGINNIFIANNDKDMAKKAIKVVRLYGNDKIISIYKCTNMKGTIQWRGKEPGIFDINATNIYVKTNKRIFEFINGLPATEGVPVVGKNKYKIIEKNKIYKITEVDEPRRFITFYKRTHGDRYYEYNETVSQCRTIY